MIGADTPPPALKAEPPAIIYVRTPQRGEYRVGPWAVIIEPHRVHVFREMRGVLFGVCPYLDRGAALAVERALMEGQTR